MALILRESGMTRTRIGIVSDTHGPLPPEVFDLFSGQGEVNGLHERCKRCLEVVHDQDGGISLLEADGIALTARPCDLILHAGDIGTQSVLDELGALAPTVAVLGNNDLAPYWCSDGAVRDLRSLTYEGVSIVMTHAPADLHLALHGKPPLVQAAVSDMPRLAVHGHTHVPKVELDGGTVVLCPGSPTRGRNGSGHNVALVDVDGGQLRTIAIIAREKVGS